MWHRGGLLRVNKNYFLAMFRVIFLGCLLVLRATLVTACPFPVNPANPNPAATRVQIDALSVNPENDSIVVFWTPNWLLDNVTGYEIFVGDGAGTGTGTIVSGIGESSGILGGWLADTSLLIRLAAINQCGDTVVRGALADIKRVFICEVEQRPCERKINVFWSDPTRSIRDIGHFEIWASIDGGNFEKRARVDDPSKRFATISVSEHSKLHRIFVRAVSLDSTIFANSIADTVTPIVAPEPEFAYINTVTVVDNETVEVRCSVDISVVWDSIFFFADDLLVRAVSYSDFLQNNRFLLPRIPHAFYHFKVSDTCGEIVIHSDTAKPILLEAELQGTTVNFTFSEYIGWTGNIIYYVFQVQNGDTSRFERLPNQSHLISFSDSVFAQIMDLSFFVVAYKISPTNEVIDSTRSNVVAVISRSKIPVHFPTAFIPNSSIEENRTFRPFFFSLPNDRMQFNIFNRFGQTVFSTTDPSHIGWDGTFNNRPVQPGTYVYQFELIRGNITTRRQGTVTLIR